MEFHKEHGNRFTERARKVLELAREEAQQQQRAQIETEHLLLALLREGEGVAARVLEKQGVHLQALRETIAGLQAQTTEVSTSQTPTSQSSPPSAEPNFTEEAKQTIQSAIVEASRLNHHYIGTEHLLLALLRLPESLAYKALQAQNIQPESVRTATVQVLRSQKTRSSTLQSTRNEEAANRDRFDRFSERARKVLSLAQEEAQRFQHNYIGTEHLLLGLAREGGGVAARSLNSMNVSLSKVREAVEFIIGRGDRIVLGEIGLTPRAKKVIELAVDEARRLNHHYIGTEHLLLGLVREGEGIASGVLESLGVKLGALRTAVLTTLQQTETPDDSENPEPDEAIRVFNTANIVHHVTKQALEAIQFADSERERLDHPTLGSEHLLLGLLHDEQSITALTFKELGVELAALYPALEALQEREELAYPWSNEHTPLAKALQDIAGHEALRLNHETIGNEHLLLALLRFPESNAIKILQHLNVDSATLRNKLLERMQQP